MSSNGRRPRHGCLICKKRIMPDRKVYVIEQGVTTRSGYEREMEVDEPALAHASCFEKSTRKYRKARRR